MPLTQGIKLPPLHSLLRTFIQKNPAINMIKQMTDAMVKMCEWYAVHYGKPLSVG